MLKLDIEALDLNHSIEFKMDDQGQYKLLVLFSKFRSRPSQVWHADHIPAAEVNELISAVAYIREHRYAGTWRVILDGTWYTAEANSFSPFRFACVEEGENGDRFLECLTGLLTKWIGDRELHERLDEID